MGRYEIRNEFSLADPELYRAADKDDPEALLEGVAMAGLVGVLRQLGDLAEFAAETFHDLHEEVLATATRGHGLMIRVQQLEAEVPSIEKAFLSQTDHSSFFNNAGVDWHPNLRMKQNLVTQGDLPRFIMDSYEECRGPPRLFLLDKFDVAGAGACLKRYTDPSFYKVEMSAMTNADAHRGRKVRKAKKKESRGREGDTPEVQPISQPNLHQFLLEDPVENGVSKPVRRGKLKRRPHFSPFDSKTGRSYMEKFVKIPSPENQMLREITEVPRPRSLSPCRESVETKEILPTDRDQNIPSFLKSETDEVAADGKGFEVYNNLTGGIPSTFCEETGEKDIPVDGESKTEGYLTIYQLDEVASEMDNFVDAPSTMDSEMDTDSDLRVNKEFTSSSINSQQIENQVEHLHSLSSDSRYAEDSTIHNDANSSSKKETPSFLSSDCPITSANRNPHSHEISTEANAPADVPETRVVDEAVSENTFDGIQVDQLSKRSFDDTCKDAVAKNRPGLEEQVRPLAETVATADDDGNTKKVIIDVTCSPGVSGSNSQQGNGSPQFYSGERLVDEPNSENGPFMSFASDVICHATGDSASISDYLLSDDDYDHKDLSQFDNTETVLTIRTDISQKVIDNAKMNNIENPHPDMSDDEVPTLTENFPSDVTDNNDNGDRITLKLSEVEKLRNELDNEGSNVISDTPNHYLCMEPSLGKELTETSLAKGKIVDTKDQCSDCSISNQIITETLIVSFTENSLGLEEVTLDACDKDFISEGETTANVTPKVGTPESHEVIELRETELSFNFSLTPNDAIALGNSSCVREYLGNPTVTSETIADGEIDLDKDVIGLQVKEISAYEGTKLTDEEHDLLGKSYSKTNKLENGAVASRAPADSDNNVDILLDLGNMVEENINSSSLGESGDEKKSLSGSPLQEIGFVEDDIGYLSEIRTKLGVTEEVCTGEASTSKLSCPMVNYYDQPILEVTVTNAYVDSGVDHTDAQSPNENKCGLDTDQEFFQKNGIENQVTDATSLSINHNAEERLSEKIKIPPANQIDEELPNSGERISESSSPMPMNHLQTLDHDLSVSGFPETRNCDLNVPEYPKDQIGFIFPSRNIFAEINQVNLDELPPLPPLPPVEWRRGRLQHALSTTVVELGKPAELFPEEISRPITSIGDISSSLEESNHALCEDVSDNMSKEQKIEQELLIPRPESSEITSLGDEGEVANESQSVKPPLPPNPLIESISVLDKSKLRKVTERVRPEIQKADERDSLLEQIKAKSFNLRPAVASRPTIKGPQTNLKVAAILERANAIRQAFVGSDEEDEEEDSWSDS